MKHQIQRKVLVIQLKMIGDVLTSSVICEHLKKKHPDCQVHFVAYQFTLEVISNNPHIDRIWEYKTEYRHNLVKIFQFILKLRNHKYDLIVDAYGKIESYLITIFSRGKIKVGYKKKYNRFFYSHRVTRLNEPTGIIPLAIINRVRLIEPLIGNDNTLCVPRIHISVTIDNVFAKKIEKLKVKGDKLLMLNITGSSMDKTYPIKYMLQIVSSILRKYPLNVILNYSPHLMDIVESKLVNSDVLVKRSIVKDLKPESLNDYIQIVSKCDVVIGNEGGGINIAKALSVPTFAIFSPQIDPNVWGLRDSNNDYVHLKEIRPEIFKNSSYRKLKGMNYLLQPHYIKDPIFRFLDSVLNNTTNEFPK